MFFRSLVRTPRFGIFPVSVPPHHPAQLPRVYFDLKVDGAPLGKVVFELFENVVPKTAENFLRLARSGTYANSQFYRILPLRGLWGGDLGKNKSVSIYGGRYVDENYAIRHDREGLLTTANVGGPNANDQRFIITMGPAQWLDRRSIAFGQVIHGMEILRQIERFGDQQGVPTRQVVVATAGQVVPQEYDQYTPKEVFDIWASHAHH